MNHRFPHLVLAVLALSILLLGPTSPAQGRSVLRKDVPHQMPVHPAHLTRVFDLPLADWLPGHRGVDLAATDMTTVRATGAGTVRFAGSVAGATWITIDHGDGLRTSLGPLDGLLVEVGDRVARGQAIATAAPTHAHDGIHWSARRDGAYFDPLRLMGRVVPRLVGPGGVVATGMAKRPGYEPWDGRDSAWGLLPSTRPADGPGWLAPPNGNHVVAVPGLMTSTGASALPLGHLGFEQAQVTVLGHAGRVDGPAGPGDQLPWSAADTFGGVERAARLLESQLRAQWATHPGVGVDLVGHSLGGVVIMHYLLAIHDPADPGLPPIDHVVTLSAPLEGADLVSASQNPLGIAELDAIVDLAGIVMGVGSDSATLADLAVGSPLLRDLSGAWQTAQADPHRSPLANGVQVLTVGGSRDLVVPEHRSDLPGADHVTVPGGHAAMRETEALLHVVRAFLQDRDVPAAPGGWGAWLSPGVSLAEQLVGVML